MKYVMVEAPEGATDRQRRIQWTYICEGAKDPKVGDVVFGTFGYDEGLMTVTAVGTYRDKLPIPDGQTRYQGPLKSCRLTTAEERRLVAETQKQWAGVKRAEDRAMLAENALADYRERFHRVD